MRAAFRDPDLHQAFEREGFVSIPSLYSSGELDGLLALRSSSASSLQAGSAEPDVATLSRQVLKIIGPKLVPLFQDYRLLHATVFSKEPRKRLDPKALLGRARRTAFPAHMDLTTVDETRYEPVVVWIPLTDVNEDNGCLWLVKGTHRLNTWRGFPFNEVLAQASDTYRKAPRIDRVPIPLSAGSVLFFHPGLVHRSGDNRTRELRVALQIYAVPSEARVLVCRKTEDGMISRYEATDDCMLYFPTPAFRERVGSLIDVIEPDPV